jgi:hypothetical protein
MLYTLTDRVFNSLSLRNFNASNSMDNKTASAVCWKLNSTGITDNDTLEFSPLMIPSWLSLESAILVKRMKIPSCVLERD